MRNLSRMALGVTLCGLFVLPAGAQQSPPVDQAETKVTNAGATAAPAAADVNECFDRWLATQPGMTEGANRRPSGTLFIARGSAELSAARGSTQWMADRQAQFNRAELTARAALARYIGEEVSSGRSVEVFQGGVDAAAPSPRPSAALVSNAERLTTLAGAQLDAAIRQFNPAWTGGTVSEEERRAQVAREQVAVRERLASRAALFAAGAMTAHQCEGPNSDGRFTVSVTLMWSLRLQDIAESIIDPSRAQRVAPATTLAEQFQARSRENPTWLSTTMGVRVWTNEVGERVVVGFGAVGGTSSASIDEDRARLQALGAIQRFVGERLEVQDTEAGEMVARETAAGERQLFDNQAYQSRIEARARTVRLQGITTLQRWRGRHPFTDTQMQVVVLVWTPSNSLTADGVRRELQEGEQRIRSGPAASASGASSGSGAVAVPTRSGASSNAADF